MGETVHLSLYRIDRCGYYEYKAGGSAVFGGIEEVFQDLAKWQRAKTFIGDTCPFGGVGDEGGPMKTFCYGVARDKDIESFLVTLWNESPGAAGGIASIDPRSPIDAPRVKMTKGPKGNVMGLPAYFWIIPEHRVFATVRFGRRPGDRHKFEKFMRAFMGPFTRYAELSAPGTPSLTVTGYRETPDGTLRGDVHPRFNSSPMVDPDVLDELRRRRTTITRVLWKDKLTAAKEQKRKARAFTSLLRLAGVIDPPAIDHEVPLHFEMSFTPSEGQLEEIISSSEDSLTGFQFDDKTVWLDERTKYRSKFEIAPKSDNQAVFLGKSLLASLEKNRKAVIGRLK